MAVQRPLLVRALLFPRPHRRDGILWGGVVLGVMSAVILGSGVARQQLPALTALTIWGQLLALIAVLSLVSAQVLVLTSRVLDGVRDRAPQAPEEDDTPFLSGPLSRRQNLRDRPLVLDQNPPPPGPLRGGVENGSLAHLRSPSA